MGSSCERRPPTNLSTRAPSFAFAGVEAFGWDPLRETQQLLNDVISLIQLRLTDLVRRRLRLRPRLTDAARLRLALLLYSHLTEVDAVAVYETLANLVKITTGKALHDGPVRRPLQTAGSRPVRTAPAICQATQNFVQFGDPTRRDLGDAPPQKSGGPARRGEQDNRSAETQMDRLQRTHGRGRGSH